MTRTLEAYINDQLVGVLREAADIWEFDYDAEWLKGSDTYDLSPALPRSQKTIVDGSTQRPVQWYFDNLLPEEGLRTTLARDAKLDNNDAFGLLAHYGAESAGSLVLRSPGNSVPLSEGLRALSNANLSKRIKDLPRVPLTHDAPKRMSMAGAQHKLPVVLQREELYEPLPGDVSTHILKPNHPDDTYSHSVMNEYFTMRLATALGLSVPNVHRKYVPEPVYLVERFDRRVQGSRVLRLHAIDTCQLLNQSRTFKYAGATLNSLAQVAEACRVRAVARLKLYRWIVFNVLVGNGDNHLKNISCLVSSNGIELADAYDLLSTAVYATRAFNETPTWPNEALAIALPNASQFGEVSRTSLVGAGLALGLARPTVERELGRLIEGIVPAAQAISDEIERENATLPPDIAARLGGEMRLLRAIQAIVIGDMLNQVR